MSNKHKHRFRKRHYKLLQPKKVQSKLIAMVDTHVASKEVIVYQSELDYLSRCILDYPDIETGGQLFGFYAAKGTPVVCYAIGPGMDANHQTTFFNQDIYYLKAIGNVLTHEYGLQHIGEWHSHHQLRLSQPSGYDAQTMHHSIDVLHLGQFLLCVGTTNGTSASVNAFSFYENDVSYYPAKWHIKAAPSPYRERIDGRLKGMLIHPVTSEPRLSGLQISRVSIPKETDVNYLLRAYNSDI